MSTSSDETETPLDRLQESLIAFTGCLGEAFDDVCSYGFTLGDSYVPFKPDPEDDCGEDEEACSQLWVRVMGVDPTISGNNFAGDSCAVDFSLELEVGLLRCFPTYEGGEAPTASDVLVDGLQAISDMNKMLCAALSCEVWESINVGTWVPLGPMGQQYGGMWTFTVVPNV